LTKSQETAQSELTSMMSRFHCIFRANKVRHLRKLD